jgi:hypothetical protein
MGDTVNVLFRAYSSLLMDSFGAWVRHMSVVLTFNLTFLLSFVLKHAWMVSMAH